jgi:hypothetical protein
MLMLTHTAYGDESTGQKISTSHFYVFGGWVAPTDVWSALERDWKTELRHERLERFHGSNHLHSPDITSRFVDVILRHDVLGYTAVVALSPLRRLGAALVEIFGQKEYHEPHLEAFRAFLQFAAQQLHGLPVEEQIGMVLHRHASGPTCLTLYEQVRESVDAEWARRLGPLVPNGDDRRLVPLQAADLLVYETWRNREHRTREPIREPLQKLIESGRIMTSMLANRYFQRLLHMGRQEQKKEGLRTKD